MTVRVRYYGNTVYEYETREDYDQAVADGEPEALYGEIIEED